MNITVLFGSPHSEGYTQQICARFLSAAADCALEEGYRAVFSYYNAYELRAAPCDDCGCCRESFICAHEDLNGLFESVSEADVLVIASPVYHLSFPAPLKAIFDRTQPFFYADRSGANPLSGNKRVGVLLLTGGAPSEKGEVMLRQLRWILPVLGCELVGSVAAPNTDAEGLSEQYSQQAEELARRTIMYAINRREGN